jgi:stringent starvation protein B
MSGMTSRRPYLIRAFYDWIMDNGLTPYLSVDADYAGVEVPTGYVVEGRIVLNISPASVHNLELGLEYILFDARFSGQSFQIVVPVKAVLAIFAKENGEGMAFVFGQQEEDSPEQASGEPAPRSAQGESVSDDDPTDPPPRPPDGRPRLKVVK